MDRRKIKILLMIFSFVLKSAKGSYFHEKQFEIEHFEKTSDYVGNIIDDENAKHNSSSLVIIIDIGKKSILTEKILRKVAIKNSIITIDLFVCPRILNVNIKFVIFTSDLCDFVSNLKVLKIFFRYFGSTYKIWGKCSLEQEIEHRNESLLSI